MSKPSILVISNFSASISSIRPEAEIFVSLHRLGFPITVMTPADSYYAKRCSSLGMKIIDYRAKSKFDLKAIQLIRKTIRDENIDIVHAFNGKSLANAAFAIIGVNVKLLGYRGYTGNIHWYDPGCYIHFLNPRVNYMVCLADSIREMFLKNGMSPKKAITIRKGHDASWYENIEPVNLHEFGVNQGYFTLSFVANRRVKMKGVEDLVRAISMIPSEKMIRVLMIGRELDQPSIVKLIDELKQKDRFLFIGYQPEVNGIVKACVAAISVSRFGEATQKAMIEAMYLSKPVIISDIPGNKGMVIDGEGGYIIKAGDPESISNAINKMLAKSMSERVEMGKNARTHVEEFLSHKKTVVEYANLYSRIKS